MYTPGFEKLNTALCGVNVTYEWWLGGRFCRPLNLSRYYDFGPIAKNRYQIPLLSRKFEFPAFHRKRFIQIFCSGE
jgi:hypothetical protein